MGGLQFLCVTMSVNPALLIDFAYAYMRHKHFVYLPSPSCGHFAETDAHHDVPGAYVQREHRQFTI